MTVESIISGKKSPHIFSDTDPSNPIISRFAHFELPFSLQNSKTTNYVAFKPFFTVFKFSGNIAEVSLTDYCRSVTIVTNN